MSFASLCVFTYTYPVPFLSKCHRKEPQRSFCGSNIIPQRSSCAFIMQPRRSSCGFQDSSSSDPQSAARRASSCGSKKKFLRVHYFWAVLYVVFSILPFGNHVMDKVWTKIYGHFHFRGIVLDNRHIWQQKKTIKASDTLEHQSTVWPFSFCVLHSWLVLPDRPCGLSTIAWWSAPTLWWPFSSHRLSFSGLLCGVARLVAGYEQRSTDYRTVLAWWCFAPYIQALYRVRASLGLRDPLWGCSAPPRASWSPVVDYLPSGLSVWGHECGDPFLFDVRWWRVHCARTRSSPSCVMAIVLTSSRCPKTPLVWLLSLGLSVGSGTASLQKLLRYILLYWAKRYDRRSIMTQISSLFLAI